MAGRRDTSFREATEALRARGNVVALTGAGISVESGIPAFRGVQGLWGKYDPMEYATIGAFLREPEKVWGMLSEMVDLFLRAVPNPAHLGLAEMERRGVLRTVITQNVDGLHRAAGSRNVIEFHGNAEELICLSCWERYPSRVKIRERMPPRCGCGTILKPNLVLYGEPIPWDTQEEAESEAKRCSVLLVVGTSAQVSPACDIPLIAKGSGAIIIEINPEETGLTRSMDTVHIREEAGKTISRILSELRGSRRFGPDSGT